MGSIAEPLPDPLNVPLRPGRRSADGAEGRLSRDRLTTMLVLAGLMHGLIILGVSFAPASDGDGASKGMEVLLVSDELPEAKRNDTATYLSQRTQTGSGNTRERLPAQMPGAAPTPAQPEAAGQNDHLEEQLLTTTGASHTRLQMVAMPDPATAQMPQPVQQRAEPQSAAGESLRLRGETRDELYVTADTKASRLAPYLDGWRRRVERIGTINYPSVAQRRGLSGNPVIEVVIQRSGKLQSVRIQRSSGYPEIDAAALGILRLASPFDPFPDELGRDYQTMRFAYEWRFEGGAPVRGALTVP